jgi:pimeloyl-ACP methyl ester carboxylesterase
MLHGLGANLGFWYAIAAQWFTRGGRVMLFDLPGHGESEMPASGYTPRHLAIVLGELLDHLGMNRVHLVAHSFGGVVALAFALRQPARVSSLVLADVRIWSVEPPSIGSPSSPWVQRMRDAGLRLNDPSTDMSFQVLVELARLRLDHAEQGPAFTALPGARSLFRGQRSAQRWLQLVETTNIYREATSADGLDIVDLGNIGQPMLAAYGEQSARKRSARTLRRVCPHCRLRMLPGAGHFFPLTRPRLFARLALDFIQLAEPRQAGARDAAALWDPAEVTLAEADQAEEVPELEAVLL